MFASFLRHIRRAFSTVTCSKVLQRKKAQILLSNYLKAFAIHAPYIDFYLTNFQPLLDSHGHQPRTCRSA